MNLKAMPLRMGTLQVGGEKLSEGLRSTPAAVGFGCGARFLGASWPYNEKDRDSDGPSTSISHSKQHAVTYLPACGSGFGAWSLKEEMC